MFRIEISGATPEEFAKNFKHMIGIFLPVIQKAEAPKEPPNVVEAVVEAEIIPPKKEKKAAKPKPEQIDIEQTIAETPDVDAVRAKLKELGAVSHEKVFEVLSKFGAKNASTVPPEKRAEVIAAVEAELKEKAE
jgi:hypothetical protein